MNHTSNSSNNQTPNNILTATREPSNSITRVVTEENTTPQQDAPSIAGIYRTITSESYRSTVIDISQTSIESFESQPTIISSQNDVNIIPHATNFTQNEEATMTRQNAIHPLPGVYFNYNNDQEGYTSEL